MLRAPQHWTFLTITVTCAIVIGRGTVCFVHSLREGGICHVREQRSHSVVEQWMSSMPTDTHGGLFYSAQDPSLVSQSEILACPVPSEPSEMLASVRAVSARLEGCHV